MKDNLLLIPNVPKVVLGTLCACISATLGGSTFVLTRLILPQTDAFTLCFLRYFLMFLVLLLIFRPKLISTKYYDKDIFYILFLGVIYFGGFPVCVAIGLSMTQASDASLVFATMPIWTVIMAFLFKIEQLTRIKQIAVTLACLGIYFAVGNYSGTNILQNLIGNIFVILGAIFASVFTVFSGNFISKYGNILVLSLTLASGVFAMFILMLFFGTPLQGSLEFNFVGWLTILFLVIPGGALMMLFWMKALQLIKPIHVSICLAFNPLSAALLGVLILNESLKFEFYIGSLLVFAAIILTQMKEKF